MISFFDVWVRRSSLQIDTSTMSLQDFIDFLNTDQEDLPVGQYAFIQVDKVSAKPTFNIIKGIEDPLANGSSEILSENIEGTFSSSNLDQREDLRSLINKDIDIVFIDSESGLIYIVYMVRSFCSIDDIGNEIRKINIEYSRGCGNVDDYYSCIQLTND